MQDQTYPTVAPTMPPFITGKATVKGHDPDTVFHVDLDAVTCDCPHGAAWRWSGKKYQPNSFCNHKLRAVASLVDHNPLYDELRDFYETELGKRYNAFVAISAFHKELRRGDTDAALFWAIMVLPHRGKHGVVAYMRNILFEETRDLGLAKFILKVSTYGKSIHILDMQRAVRRFCSAPKKWTLPWRYDIFLDEMRGYKDLAHNYGYEVAKAKDIIPESQIPGFQDALLQGFAEGDARKVQYGLKGWFKSKSRDHDHMKIDIFNYLVNILNDEYPNAFRHDKTYALELHAILMTRLQNHGGVGYHELNALCDALTGENARGYPATLPAKLAKRDTLFPRRYRVPLGVFPKVPLYAHDNHTWDGKRRMTQFGNTQLRPGAAQTDLDFRLCGAYMGVAWRYLAYRQHATIDCKWEDVSWSKPSWLWSHTKNMFY